MKSEYVKACGNCVHLTYLPHNNDGYCELRGPVSENGKCGKYRFDLLKVKPAPPVTIENYESEIDR